MAKRKLNDTNIAGTSKRQNTDINSEDNVIKYCLMPSLQHAAITKIIITLWNRVDFKGHIAKLSNEHEDYISVSAIEFVLLPDVKDKMLEKLSEIAVPNRIRKTISNIIDPILNEILDWIAYQRKYIFYDGGHQDVKATATNYIDALVWTSRGTIDYKETAKTLIAKQALSDDLKCNIACAYCLEDNIEMLASKVINTTLNLKSLENQAMVCFWNAHMKGEFTELDEAVNAYNNQSGTNFTRNECIFAVLIANETNPIAIKYMWHKLSNEEKSRQIVDSIISTDDVDINCFLLSQITKEQEKEIYKTDYAEDVLLRFFDHWLWGQYFVPMMRNAYSVMSRHVGSDILEYIMEKIINYRDIEECKLHKATFKELWQWAPQHFKEYVFALGNVIDEEEVMDLVQF